MYVCVSIYANFFKTTSKNRRTVLFDVDYILYYVPHVFTNYQILESGIHKMYIKKWFPFRSTEDPEQGKWIQLHITCTLIYPVTMLVSKCPKNVFP